MNRKVMNHKINITDMQLVRKGKCQPDKCKSACCKFYMTTQTNNMDDYIEGFFENTNKFGDHYIIKNCKHLDVKKNKCKAWGKDNFPEVCKQFPNPTDSVYKHCFDACTFKFEMEPVESTEEDKDLVVAIENTSM